MQRITIAMDDDLAAELDRFIDASGASNRSEAIRDLVRRGLAEGPARDADAGCLAVLSYAIDNSVRDLARRVPQGRLDRHDQTVASLSIPLDHSSSVDVVVMRGNVGHIGDYAKGLFLERGVLHGALALIPVREETHEAHHHPHEGEHDHVHLKVQETF